MIILLFDLDGVLLQPHGYQKALSDTVTQIAEALGFAGVHLSFDLIDRFESVGLTSEWDSSAACAALLLDRAWTHDPTLQLPTSLPFNLPPQHNLPPPDFKAFAQALGEAGTNTPAMDRARHLIVGNSKHSEAKKESLRALMLGARDPQKAITYNLFQERILGSETYSETYNLMAHLDTESYLLSFDRPTLSLEERGRLENWLEAPDHFAAIFTNRPTPWPDGSQGTPEGQLGVQLCNLSAIPIVGYGEMTWLSALHGERPEAFLKPSPIHTLAALQSALGKPPATAARSAVDLLHSDQGEEEWRVLDGCMVYVFEDSAKGFQSALGTRDTLASIGVTLELRFLGVGAGSAKGPALEATGARLYPSLGHALQEIDDLELR
ncbi:MAG: hypothetical protein GTO14_17895 [Anaerolineales bacterium]|nr:hypothetical protein [Anaerolineales bacterium]